MRPHHPWLRLAPLAALALATFPATTPALACAVSCRSHDTSGLILSDARILGVAIATRQAVETGVIPAAAQPATPGLAQPSDASLLESWIAKETSAGLTAENPVRVVLVDSDARFLLSRGPQGVSVSADAPGDDIRQIITTRRTLLALLDRTLVWDKAREHGLLVADASDHASHNHAGTP